MIWASPVREAQVAAGSAGLVMAYENVELIRQRGRLPGWSELVAHHLAILAAAGAQVADAVRRINRHRGDELHRGGVVNDGVWAVPIGGVAAAFGALDGAVGVHAGRVIVSVQSICNRANSGRVAGRLLQRQDVNRLGRVAAHDLFANPFEHAAVGDAAPGRSNQTRQRSGCAIDVILNVVGDDAQGSGLGGSDRSNAAGEEEDGAGGKQPGGGGSFHS